MEPDKTAGDRLRVLGAGDAGPRHDLGAVVGLAPGVAPGRPAAMPAAESHDAPSAGTDPGRGVAHLTVYARLESTEPLQPAYIVHGARGRLYVRAFSEVWRPEAERLEAVLNKAVADRGD